MTSDSAPQVCLLFDEVPTVCRRHHSGRGACRGGCRLHLASPLNHCASSADVPRCGARSRAVAPLDLTDGDTGSTSPERLVCDGRSRPVLPPAPSDLPAFVDRLAIVTWNVHVGFGDVRELIRRLQSGTYTGGERIEHFVLLLQEAYRRDGGVPARTSVRLRLPARVGARNLGKRGADIDRFVRDQRLSLLYVPSMRNGGDPDAPEDRGNAIVSTLPLDSPAVIELPFEHQRRAAALAVVEGCTRAGLGWRLGVVDVHFDTALALTRGGPLAARRRQAAALVEALAAAPDDIVLGGDFNTWLGFPRASVESAAPGISRRGRSRDDDLERTARPARQPRPSVGSRPCAVAGCRTTAGSPRLRPLPRDGHHRVLSGIAAPAAGEWLIRRLNGRRCTRARSPKTARRASTRRYNAFRNLPQFRQQLARQIPAHPQSALQSGLPS